MRYGPGGPQWSHANGIVPWLYDSDFTCVWTGKWSYSSLGMILWKIAWLPTDNFLSLKADHTGPSMKSTVSPDTITEGTWKIRFPCFNGRLLSGCCPRPWGCLIAHLFGGLNSYICLKGNINYRLCAVNRGAKRLKTWLKMCIPKKKGINKYLSHVEDKSWRYTCTQLKVAQLCPTGMRSAGFAVRKERSSLGEGGRGRT